MKTARNGVDASRRDFAIGGLALTLLSMTRAFASAAPADATGPTSAQLWSELVAGNRRFMDGKPRARDIVTRRLELAAGQAPRAVVLGCSDSRVTPEAVFDQKPGDLFVVRVAGNVADPVALGSIEYAVEHFPVRVLVILGHEKCGAVDAAAAGGKAPTPNLEALLQKIEPAVAPLRRRATGADLVKLGVEANVRHTASDVLQGSPLIRAASESKKVMLVKAVYRLATGEVVKLE